MFTSSLTEEVKAIEEDIEAVKDKVEDPLMCEKVRQFVYAPKDIQDFIKADAGPSPPSIALLPLIIATVSRSFREAERFSSHTPVR
jgi:hypothetical protein